MAHAFAKELNVTPWEALLTAVRIAAGKVAFCESKLAEAQSDLELEGRVERLGEGAEAMLIHPDTREPLGVGAFTDLSFWVEKSEYWHDKLARVAKMAIDAGVAEKLVQAQMIQVQLVTRPIEAALAVLELSHEQELEVRAAMRRELAAIESENAATLDGEVVHVDEEK